MADRIGLKFVGFTFAAVTLAVVMICAHVVKSHADGRLSLDNPAAYARAN